MGISINGPSGIDTAYIIDSLVDLERNRIRSVEKVKSAYQVKIDAYSKFRSLVTDLSVRAFNLSSIHAFNLYKQTSSNESLVTISGGTGSVAGRYEVGIAQVARAEKMISEDGLITNQSASIADLGITGGTIRVNGTDIVVADSDTIQDLRMKINAATDSSGKKIGVTASVIKTSESNFRLVLTADKTGKAGATYEDVSGDVLQKLGIILTPQGDKGITYQTFSTQGNFLPGVGDRITYGGTDHEGNLVSNTFIMTPGSTVDDFLRQVEATFQGTVSASITGGKLVVENKTGGRSQFSIDTVDISDVSQDLEMTVVGRQGRGVLSVGRDAYFNVDGINMESSTNQAGGFIAGVTLNLLKASQGEQVTVEIERDIGAVAGRVEEMLNSYNAIVRFMKENTAYGDPNNSKSKKGDLAGDMTLSSMVSQMRTIFQRQYDLLGGAFRNLAALGVKTDTQKGELTLDREMLTRALQNDFEEVTRVFVTTGFSSNNGITFGLSGGDTQPGVYEVEEFDDNQRVRIRLQGDSQWYESSPRAGDVVTFTDGPAKGLSLTFPSATLQSGENAVFTFSKGLSALLKEAADKITDSREGVIHLRQESWRKGIKSSEERITRLEASVERYRERLVKQFSAMEKNLSQLQSQSNNMLGALGFLRSRK